VTLPKGNLPLDGVNFLKVSPDILKIRPSRSDFQPGGLITLPYSSCSLNDNLSYQEETTMTKTNYTLVARQLAALTEGIPYEVANLANASALLWQEMPEINWVGFYKMMGGKLVLGPFQGKPACIEIPVGNGVCGTAVAEDAAQLVYDVHQFPGHIACDCASNSEIVLPIHVNGEIWGVLDIDSPKIGRFTEADKAGLLEIVGILEQIL